MCRRRQTQFRSPVQWDDEACVCTAMLHGSETWGPTEPELPRHRGNDCAMIRWICGIIDRDQTPSASLLQKLGIMDITSVLRCWLFRWCGHVPNLSQTFRFPALERKKGPTRHGLNVFRLMSMSVAQLALTHLWEIHGVMENQCSILPGAANPIQWETDNTLIYNGYGWMDGWMDGRRSSTSIQCSMGKIIARINLCIWNFIEAT